MAMLFAVRDGLTDARADRPPYLWTIFSHPDQRRRLLADGLKAIGKIFILAVILDVVYQLMVLRRIYPVETIDVAIILAVVPVHCCVVRSTDWRGAGLSDDADRTTIVFAGTHPRPAGGGNTWQVTEEEH